MIDLERFVRSRVRVLNDTGGRGYDSGLRTFDCPICRESRGRGWLGVTGWGAGCFNVGCTASPHLDGGAVEWARRVLGLATRGEAWGVLERDFSSDRVVARPSASQRSADFCRLPVGSRPFEYPPASPMQREFDLFVGRQWGLGGGSSLGWRLRWCMTGWYTWRVVIPVVMGDQVVGFQARTIREEIEQSKYVTSRHGPESDLLAECGRPAAAMLFNADALRAGCDVLVVEGAADVMGWAARGDRHHVAVGLLGVALTPEKLSLISLARPRRAVVALDDEPAALRRAAAHVEDLRAWGVEAVLGRWSGGKDAGSGASLVIN